MKINKTRSLPSVTGSSLHLRFRKIERPAFADTLVFPSDVTSLTPQNVSELMGKYTALLAFANQELTRVSVELLKLRTEMEILGSTIFTERPNINGIERWKRDAIIEADPRMLRLKLSIRTFSIEKEYATMYVANFDRYIVALSRELSRKMSERPNYAG